MCLSVRQRKPAVRSSAGIAKSPTLTIQTVPWGLPCTVSAGTYLFPRGLDMSLGPEELAETAGIKTCFLCTRVNMSADAAAEVARILGAQLVFTVGEFLELTLEECMDYLPRTVVKRLDRFFKGCPGLPEHAAPGTLGGCEMLLHYRHM